MAASSSRATDHPSLVWDEEGLMNQIILARVMLMYWHAIYVLYCNTQNILYVRNHLNCVFSLSQRFLMEFFNSTYQFGNSIMLLKVLFNESETIIILNFIYKNPFDVLYSMWRQYSVFIIHGIHVFWWVFWDGSLLGNCCTSETNSDSCSDFLVLIPRFS